MRTDVEVQDLPTRLLEVIALAKAGDEVVLMNQGNALAMLVPIHGTADSLNPGRKVPILGLRPGAIVLAPDFNDPLPDEFWMGE